MEISTNTGGWATGTGLCIAMAAATAAPAMGGNLVLDAQDRSISATIPAVNGVPADAVSETIEAEDFGPFNAMLDEVVDIGPPFSQLSTSTSSQNSSFGVQGSDYVISAAGSAAYTSVGVGQITFSQSDFELTFTLNSVTDYELTGTGTRRDGAGGAGGFGVRLFEGVDFVFDAIVFNTFATADSGPDFDGEIDVIDLAEAGQLQPGQYTFRANAGVSGGVNGGQVVPGAYDVELLSLIHISEPTRPY